MGYGTNRHCDHTQQWMPCIAKAEYMELHSSTAHRQTQWLTSKCGTVSVNQQLNNRKSLWHKKAKRHQNPQQSSYLEFGMLTAHWKLRQDNLGRLYIYASLYTISATIALVSEVRCLSELRARMVCVMNWTLMHTSCKCAKPWGLANSSMYTFVRAHTCMHAHPQKANGGWWCSGRSTTLTFLWESPWACSRVEKPQQWHKDMYTHKTKEGSVFRAAL